MLIYYQFSEACLMKKTKSTDLDSALDILKKWECAHNKINLILNLNENSLQDYRKSGIQITVNPEQQNRISKVIQMDEDLHMAFSNPKNIYGFMRMINNNVYFEGRTPLSIIETGSLQDLKDVASRIHALVIR